MTGHLQPGDAAGNIENPLTLQADRLKTDRILQSTEQRIGTCADACRCFTARTEAMTFAGTTFHATRGKYRPRQIRFIGETDITADLADRANIVITQRYWRGSKMQSRILVNVMTRPKPPSILHFRTPTLTPPA